MHTIRGGGYLEGIVPVPPLGAEKNVLIFNVKNMLKFELFWNMYPPGRPPFQISKYMHATAYDVVYLGVRSSSLRESELVLTFHSRLGSVGVTSVTSHAVSK